MSLLLIFLVLITILFFGLPLLFLTGIIGKDENNYLLAPFVGISIVILFLQNLVYLNITLRESTWILWIIGGIAWIATLYFKKAKLPSKKIAGVFIIAFIALTISGWGYISSNYEECHGNCWIDQFNYASISQVLIDYEFDSSYSDVLNKPFAIKGTNLKQFRIGQSILNGFFTVSTFTEAKNFFGPMILLMPFLVVLAVYLIASHFLCRPYALLSGFIAGIFPTLTTLHLDNFLSHALSVGFLLLIPYLIAQIIEKRTFVHLIILALIINTTLNVYFELTLIIAGIIFLAILSTIVTRTKNIKKLGLYLILLPILMAATNPFFLWKLVDILPNYDIYYEGVLENIYPFAFTRNMIPTLFFGNTITGQISLQFSEPIAEKIILLLNFTAYILFSIALTGWGGIISKKSSKIPLTIICLGLIAVPLILLSHPKNYPYQFFKLLTSISPLLIIGLIYGLTSITNFINLKKITTPLICIIIIPLIAANISLTYTGLLNQFRDEKFENARETLSTTKNQNIVIDSSHHIVNAWLGYFAKDNNIWLLNGQYGGSSLWGGWGNETILLDNVPGDALLYTYEDNSFTPFNKEEALEKRKEKGYTTELPS